MSASSPPASPGGQARAPCTLVENWAWPYADALAWMDAAHARVVAGGIMEIGVGSHAREVITLGRHAPRDQVRDEDALRRRGAEIVRIGRGGGATAHGPGQVVLYPVINLRTLGLSIPEFCWLLEESALRLLREEEIIGKREPGLPGVYVDGRKIASLGFRSRRGVVTHGLAINGSNDVELFSCIEACGEKAREATSMDRERARSGLASERRSASETVSDRVRRRGHRLAAHFMDLAMLTCKRDVSHRVRGE